MTITIVCGHYFSEMGYLEVHLAKTLVKEGHRVNVICSDKIPNYVRHLVSGVKAGTTRTDGVEITRLKAGFSLGQMVKSPGIMKVLRSQQPDMAICIGLGKLFPAPVFEASNLPFPVVTLLGDNEQSFSATGKGQRLKNAFLQKLLKAPVYRNAIRKSRTLYSYTPDAPDIISGFLGDEWRQRLLQKHRFISLGFDPDEFYFDDNLRTEYRQRLTIEPTRKTIVCFTRVVPEKKLHELPAILAATEGNFVFVLGGLGRSDYCQQLRSIFAAHLPTEKYRLLNFVPRGELNGWYSAADVAVFTTAAISIFEALGTGLPLLLPKVKSLSHILDSKTNGRYYANTPNRQELEAMLNDFSFSKEDRLQRQSMAHSQFSWKQIAEEIVSGV